MPRLVRFPLLALILGLLIPSGVARAETKKLVASLEKLKTDIRQLASERRGRYHARERRLNRIAELSELISIEERRLKELSAEEASLRKELVRLGEQRTTLEQGLLSARFGNFSRVKAVRRAAQAQEERIRAGLPVQRAQRVGEVASLRERCDADNVIDCAEELFGHFERERARATTCETFDTRTIDGQVRTKLARALRVGNRFLVRRSRDGKEVEILAHGRGSNTWVPLTGYLDRSGVETAFEILERRQAIGLTSFPVWVGLKGSDRW